MDLAEYREIIRFLNTQDERKRVTKPHRLPNERYTVSDCEFFITICARHQKNPFTDPHFAQQIINALLWWRTHHQLMLFCYCLMPDHLHFIVQLPDLERKFRNGGVRGIAPQTIMDLVGDFKSYVTSQLWWKCGGTGKLWQRSSYDNVIRSNDSVNEAVAYVLNNPERKGLIDYPYAAVVDPWM